MNIALTGATGYIGGAVLDALIEGAESVAIQRGVAINVLGTHLRPDAAASVRQLAERTVALRARTTAALERAGATVLDEPADKLPVALVDHYLLLKRQGLLWCGCFPTPLRPPSVQTMHFTEFATTGVAVLADFSRDTAMAARLWTVSESLVRDWLPA